MAYSKSQVTKKINFKIPDGVNASEMQSEIGEYIIDEILRNVGQGKSPVDGYGAFQSLTAAYADREKGGDTLANLELDGDMLADLDWRPTSTGIEIGFFDANVNTAKAYGHNTGMKGHKILKGKAPVRRFIPNSKEKFNSDIVDGIKEIKRELKQQAAQDTFIPGEAQDDIQPADSILSDLFLRDIVGELLGQG